MTAFKYAVKMGRLKCGSGHARTKENTRWYPDGALKCLECHVLWTRKWRQKIYIKEFNNGLRPTPLPTKRGPRPSKTCRAGHLLNKANLYVNLLKHRVCRVCRRAAQKKK